MPQIITFGLVLLSGVFLIASAWSWLRVARAPRGALSFAAVRKAAAVTAIGLGLLGITLIVSALVSL